MKDYSYEARRRGLYVSRYFFDDDNVKEYFLCRDNNTIEIKYMNGDYKSKQLSEVDMDEINDSQRRALETLKKEIFPAANKKIALNGSLCGLHMFNSILHYLNGNYFAGSCWLTSSGAWFFMTYPSYQLKREMKLVSWIYDNKDQVNEVIKEDVQSNMQIPELASSNDKNIIYEYPKELVPYSEELYTEGINLNNISELKPRQLRKLKRKTIAKQRHK